MRSTTQIWVVTGHQYGIPVVVSQTSFQREPVVVSGSVVCFSGYTYTLRLNETIQCFCRSVRVKWMECDRVCCAQSRSKRANRNMWQRSPLGFITITLQKINDSVRFFGPWVPDHVTTILWHYIYLWQTAVIVKVRCTLMF